MQQGGTIVWVIDADSKAFAAALQKASGQAKTFGNQLEQSTASKVSSFTKNAANNLTSLADSMSALTRAGIALAASGGISIGAFVKTASELETTSKQVQVLTGSVEGAQRVYGELYNYVLGKPITFPDASKAAKTLLGYGRTVDQVIPDMKTLSTLSIVNGADLQALALVFGQVTSRGALFGQDALQLINNNIPLTTILARKFGISMQEASEKINGGKVSAEEFTEAMAEYANSLDISSMSDTFQNRMISLGGTIRSLGLALLGIRIDPVKGFVVEAGGLFDTLSKSLEEFVAFLKTPEMREGIIQLGKNLAQSAKDAMPFIKDVLLWLVNNFDLVIGLVKAFTVTLVALRVAAFALNAISVVASTINGLQTAFAGAQAAAAGFKLAMAGIGAAGAQGNAFAMLGVGIGNFVKLIGGVPGLIRTGLMAIPGIISAAGGAIMSALYAIPVIGWIALIVTALVGVFLYFYNTSEDFRNFINNLFSGILDGIKAGWEGLVGFFGGVWDGIVKGAEAVGGFFAGLWDGIVKGVTPIVNTVVTVFQTIGNVIGTVISTVISILTPLWQIIGLIGYAIAGFGQIVFTIFSAIGQIIWTIVSTIVQIIGIVLIGTIMKLWEGVVWVFTNIGSFINTALTAAAAAITTIWNGIVSFLTPILTTIGEFFSTVFNTIAGVISTVFNAISTTITTVWNAVVAFLTPAINAIAAVFSTVFNAVAGVVNRIFGLIKQYIINPISEVVGFVGRTIGQIATFIGDAVTNAYNAVANFVGRFTQAGRNIIDGIVNGIKNGADAVVDVIKNICSNALNAVKSFFGIKSPSRVMAQMGNYLMEGFGKGINDEADTVINAAESAADGVLGAFDNMAANVGSMQSQFGVDGSMAIAPVGTVAPVSVSSPDAGADSANNGITINQTNEVYTELDMDQINRNLTWELNKL